MDGHGGQNPTPGFADCKFSERIAYDYYRLETITNRARLYGLPRLHGRNGRARRRFRTNMGNKPVEKFAQPKIWPGTTVVISIDWKRIIKDIRKYFYWHIVFGMHFESCTYPPGHKKQYMHRRRPRFTRQFITQGIINLRYEH